jgi:Putative DNA-binding domain
MNPRLIDEFDCLMKPLDVVARYVRPKVSETNHLEFKQKRDPKSTALDLDDRKNFSKAISSFSNSNGGILVWGVSTKKTNGRDAASSSFPIHHADEFAERLRDSLLDTTMPANHQVQIRALVNRLGNGYVVCLVPQSAHSPLRSMIAGREYWVRMDGRSRSMEHYQIRDMMLSRAVPDLLLTPNKSGDILPADQIKIDFAWLNSGLALAKYVGAFMRIEGATIVSTLGDIENLGNLNPFPAISHYGGTHLVVHPNGIRANMGSVVILPEPGSIEIRLLAKWYCENMTAKDEIFTIIVPERQTEHPSTDSSPQVDSPLQPQAETS